MKDYYLLLGVDKNADKSEIKKAYRDSAKRFHPDADAEIADSKQFRDITEAYETLRDNNRRREYDDTLFNTVPEMVSHDDDVEPLRPHNSRYQQHYEAKPFATDYSTDIPIGTFGRDERQKRALFCRVHLTPQEIQRDVAYPYSINIIRPCPHCHNILFSGFRLSCPYCNDSQYLCIRKELVINIPQGTSNGTCVKLDLGHIGLYNACLVVNVSISEDL